MNNEHASSGWALWALGFRPFYLFGALAASLSMLVWVVRFVPGVAGLPLLGGMPAMLWHAHEMVFGFTLAIVTGFLLTAVRAWTGIATLHGRSLAALAGLWCAGRALMLTDYTTLAGITVTLFPLSVAWAIGVPLWRAGNRRNAFLLVLLLVFAMASASFHFALIGHFLFNPLASLHIALDVMLLIMAAIGGRVIPMFTNNGVPHARAVVFPMLERIALGLLLLLLVLRLLNVPDTVQALAAFAGAAAHGARLYLWQPLKTRRTPLVWILHVGYVWLVIHLLLRGFAFLQILPGPLATHALTTGAIGALTIGMMTRTARGHTGRALLADRWEVSSYAMIVTAAAVRILGGAWPDSHSAAMLASGLLWSAGFGLYVWRYWPILTRPRIDGQPG